MESLHYLLMKSHSAMQRNILVGAKELGLTLGQPKILDYLLQVEGQNQKTIAEYCEIEPATLGSILLRMEARGYVERRQKDGNRRSLYVYLTDRGRTRAEEMKDIFAGADERAVKGLSEDEVKELRRLLLHVCKNLKGGDDKIE